MSGMHPARWLATCRQMCLTARVNAEAVAPGTIADDITVCILNPQHTRESGKGGMLASMHTLHTANCPLQDVPRWQAQ